VIGSCYALTTKFNASLDIQIQKSNFQTVAHLHYTIFVHAVLRTIVTLLNYIWY